MKGCHFAELMAQLYYAATKIPVLQPGPKKAGNPVAETDLIQKIADWSQLASVCIAECVELGQSLELPTFG